MVEVPPRYLMVLSRAICKQTSIFYNKSIILWVIVVWLTCRQAWVGPLRGESWGTCLRHKQFHSVSPPPPLLHNSFHLLAFYSTVYYQFITAFWWVLSISVVHFFLISNISDVKVSESKPVFCLWERTILTFT